MRKKNLTEEEVIEECKKIANHSIAIWRIALKLYDYHNEERIPEKLNVPVSILIKTIDSYINDLEKMNFIEKRTIN